MSIVIEGVSARKVEEAEGETIKAIMELIGELLGSNDQVKERATRDPIKRFGCILHCNRERS
jgi:hypothetical protein